MRAARPSSVDPNRAHSPQNFLKKRHKTLDRYTRPGAFTEPFGYLLPLVLR
jgi:hypothetical protein